MNLKDCIESDINKLFFNKNEFATEVNIDGNTISVVIDDDLLKKHNLKNGGEGLAMGELLFHVSKSDFPFIPKRGHDLMFNEEFYYIGNVEENEGMYTIKLEAPQS